VTRLADSTWPELAELARAGAVLVVPIGATEQHGPHLPVTTDADLAVAVVEAAAASRCTRSGATANMSDVSVRPAWRSPSHRGHQPVTGRPSSANRRSARAMVDALPPWAQARTTWVKTPVADRPSCTRSSSVASWPMDRVPANPSCSPDEP